MSHLCEAGNSFYATPKERKFALYATARLTPHAMDRGVMLSAADIREWMKKVMVEHDLSVHDWAKKAGVSPSTIFRAI